MVFEIGFSPAGKRQYLKLIRRNPEALTRVQRMAEILKRDPYNMSRQFDIRKLTELKAGQWRIRSGNYRIRYDIDGDRIVIHEVFHRQRGY